MTKPKDPSEEAVLTAKVNTVACDECRLVIRVHQPVSVVDSAPFAFTVLGRVAITDDPMEEDPEESSSTVAELARRLT